MNIPPKLIPIRLSHLIGHNSVGSIVHGANELVVVQDTRRWTDRQGAPAGKPIAYVERVRAALGIQEELREPPVARELADGRIEGVCVPATRFPFWTRCPNCGFLYYKPWRKDTERHESRCRKCERRPQLVQVPWVLVHPDGYLSEVPWRWLAHSAARDPEQTQCKLEDQLRLLDKQGHGKRIQCDACKARKVFTGGEQFKWVKKCGHPWLGKNDDVSLAIGNGDGQEDKAQILSISDTRVYSPKCQSALVIPPESRVRKGTVVDRLYRNTKDRRRIDGARTRLARKSVLRTLATEYRCTPGEIEDALKDIAGGYPLYGENPTRGQVREDEFRAFLEELPDQRDDEDFVNRNKSDEWRVLVESVSARQGSMASGVQHLVRVDRLKAIKVFQGFTRLGGKEAVPPDIVGRSDWLPAIELYGEGIFFALDEDRLRTWECDDVVEKRLEELMPRFVQWGRDTPNPLTSRFMLLHTLSHLLMRQIEAEGGYPAAWLHERIYCSRPPEPMAGILIYVAVPDIAGSLGGLAELAEPRRFLGILVQALEHSRWCSLDPVCKAHDGQGPGLLNRAACHACTLVPEPACEFDNALLDRMFVSDDEASPLPAYFGMS